MQDVTEAIVELVAEGCVQGSRLANELRVRFPEWTPQDVGARNLKSFVEQHVAGVDVVGRSGMDVIYGLAGSMTPGENVIGRDQKSAKKSADINFWRIWVSPNSPYAIAVDADNGSVTAVGRDEAVGADLRKLQPIGQPEHKEIARGFLSEIAGDDHDRLSDILTSASDDWWQTWLRKIESIGAGDRWHRARSSALDDAQGVARTRRFGAASNRSCEGNHRP